jgi:hypothetical protein
VLASVAIQRSSARGHGRLLLAALAALAAGGCLAAAAQAEVLNVAGNWRTVYHCEVGWCKGQDFPADATLQQAPGSTNVTLTSGAKGTIEGHTLTIEGAEGSYSYKETLTIAGDAQSWSGALTDSNSTSGTDTAVRLSGGSEEGAARERREAKEAAEATHAHEVKVAEEELAFETKDREDAEDAEPPAALCGEAEADEAADSAALRSLREVSPVLGIAARAKAKGPKGPPPGFIRSSNKSCPLVAKPAGPIDAEAAARKAEDEGYSQAMADSSAENAILTTEIGVATVATGQPIGTGMGIVVGGAAAVENRLSVSAAVRAKDPPDRHFTKIASTRVPVLALPPGARSLPAPGRALLVHVLALEARSGALGSAAAVSVNRAASAHAAHSRKWERRQMLADADFSAKLAATLTHLAGRLQSPQLSSLLGTLASRPVTAASIRQAAGSAAGGSLPGTLLVALEKLRVPKAQQKLLAWRMSTARPASAGSITFGPLLAQVESASASYMRQYASNLHALAIRVRHRPRSANSS